MAPFPASGVAAHHMQLIVIALQPMTPVTAVAKRGHWQQVCRAFTANTVTQADTVFEASTAHVTTHDAVQVQSASRDIFVELDLSPSLFQHQLIVSASRWILDVPATPYT